MCCIMDVSPFHIQLYAVKDVGGMVSVSRLENVDVMKGGQE